MKKLHFLMIAIALCGLTSCNKLKPQTPATKQPPAATDSKSTEADNKTKESPKPQVDKATAAFQASLSQERLPVQNSGKWGYSDGAGKIVIKPQFDLVFEFSEDMAVVQKNEKWGYIDKTGKLVISPQFDYAFPFSEGLAEIRINSNYGYIDKTGKFIISPQLDGAYEFAEGLAPVEIDSKWGYISK